MITVHCDGCEDTIDRDTQPWFGVDFTAALHEPSSDPVQQMNEVEEMLTGALLSTFDGNHKHHFCSATCLSGWAFRQELEAE